MTKWVEYRQNRGNDRVVLKYWSNTENRAFLVILLVTLHIKSNSCHSLAKMQNPRTQLVLHLLVVGAESCALAAPIIACQQHKSSLNPEDQQMRLKFSEGFRHHRMHKPSI